LVGEIERRKCPAISGRTDIDYGQAYVYDFATTVVLVAVPDAGFQFVGWSGDLDGVSDPFVDSTTLVVYEDFVIQANFAPLPPVPALLQWGMAMLVTVLVVCRNSAHHHAALRW
jgi:hypothetical protein